MTGKRYLGNIITNNPTNPAGPFQDGAASGIWSVSEAETFKRAGLWPTAGNTNPNEFVENVFSTFLYTGTGANPQTVTNNIDLSSGGLVWVKSRALRAHAWYDTERGTNSVLFSNNSGAASTVGQYITYNNNGFALTSQNNDQYSGEDYCSWTFKKASKFFDIVTYTGNGSNRTISHNLGAVPGMILVKKTNGSTSWRIWHRSLGNSKYIRFQTDAATNDSSYLHWSSTAHTATTFSVGTNVGTNNSGDSYVAYLFGHDTSSDGMIQCGSISGSNGRADLGFEPQWLLLKSSNYNSTNWIILDVMRGWTSGGSNDDAHLFANLSNAEADYNGATFDATGFNYGQAGDEYIYMAIRRGPMATPTSASSVFNIQNSTTNNPAFTSTNIIDTAMFTSINSNDNRYWSYRLKDKGYLYSNASDTQPTGQNAWDFGASQFGHYHNPGGLSGYRGYFWRRAPGYHDVVAYTGTGSNQNVSHSLTVVPEMIWIKSTDAYHAWAVYHSATGNTGAIYLNSNEAEFSLSGSTVFNNTTPTSSVFTVGTNNVVNQNTKKYVAFLFATVAGVSKVGSVSHSGSSTDVDCGFSSGASLVMLKRTDSTGDWYWWDSTSGIVAGNDPYFLLNTQDAQVTNTDLIDPLSSGFTITDDFTDGDYIFYAIAT